MSLNLHLRLKHKNQTRQSSQHSSSSIEERNSSFSEKWIITTDINNNSIWLILLGAYSIFVFIELLKKMCIDGSTFIWIKLSGIYRNNQNRFQWDFRWLYNKWGAQKISKKLSRKLYRLARNPSRTTPSPPPQSYLSPYLENARTRTRDGQLFQLHQQILLLHLSRLRQQRWWSPEEKEGNQKSKKYEASQKTTYCLSPLLLRSTMRGAKTKSM